MTKLNDLFGAVNLPARKKPKRFSISLFRPAQRHVRIARLLIFRFHAIRRPCPSTLVTMISPSAQIHGQTIPQSNRHNSSAMLDSSPLESNGARKNRALQIRHNRQGHKNPSIWRARLRGQWQATRPFASLPLSASPRLECAALITPLRPVALEDRQALSTHLLNCTSCNDQFRARRVFTPSSLQEKDR